MRDPERIDKIITLIADIWHQYPDWRLTQILSNSNALGDSTDRINFFGQLSTITCLTALFSCAILYIVKERKEKT